MNVPVVAFFNNKGGVGKTTLVYHLAWMYANLGLRVLAADLDPQANLTAAFLEEDQLEALYDDETDDATDAPRTVFQALRRLIGGTGDILPPTLHAIDDDHQLALIAGDLALSGFEDDLSINWSGCMDGKERAFRVESAFWRILQEAARRHEARLVLVDLGPNLGALNRAALLTADFVVMPLAPDLFSVKGLTNLGPTLRRWRAEWGERLTRNPESKLALPRGEMEPAGYVVLQHAIRLDRPTRAYDRWMQRIPVEYRRVVLDEAAPSPANTDHCLARLKHYRSLMPMAQEARKPIFFLKVADGALGAHLAAVQEAYSDFQRLAHRLAQRIALPLPE